MASVEQLCAPTANGAALMSSDDEWSPERVVADALSGATAELALLRAERESLNERIRLLVERQELMRRANRVFVQAKTRSGPAAATAGRRTNHQLTESSVRQ